MELCKTWIALHVWWKLSIPGCRDAPGGMHSLGQWLKTYSKICQCGEHVRRGVPSTMIASLGSRKSAHIWIPPVSSCVLVRLSLYEWKLWHILTLFVKLAMLKHSTKAGVGGGGGADALGGVDGRYTLPSMLACSPKPDRDLWICHQPGRGFVGRSFLEMLLINTLG